MLIERSKKKFPTNAGRRRALRIQQTDLPNVRVVDSKSRRSRTIVSGSIRVATIYSIGLHVLRPIDAFSKTLPSVNLPR